MCKWQKSSKDMAAHILNNKENKLLSDGNFRWVESNIPKNRNSLTARIFEK